MAPRTRSFRLLAAVILVLTWSLGFPVRADVETTMVGMRDGTKLATYVHVPTEVRPKYPVIVVRTPYTLDMLAETVADFVKHGYVCVVQHTRGRHASEGKDMALSDEGWGVHQDGADTIAWVKKQDWCNGRIGTWGMSAVGITQVLMAGATTDVACQSISFAASSFYGQFTYQGGVFRKLLMEDWLKAMQATQMLDVWRNHPEYDSYWRYFDGRTCASRVTAPGLHIGGWWDIFCQGTIDNFTSRQHGGGPGAKGNQKLVMGAWQHGPNPKPGDLVMPDNFNFDYGGYERRFLDHWLKNEENGIEAEPAVRYYTVGDVSDPSAPGNEWRTAADWPPFPTQETAYYLQSDRTLTLSADASDGALAFTYDPANPCPTHGGAELTTPPGPFDQRSISTRADVLAFATQPLGEPLEATGSVKVRLFVSTDAPDTDFTAKLVDIYPDGREILMLDSIRRVKFRNGYEKPEPLSSGTIGMIEIDLWSISLIFNKGHRIGVQISSSNYPRFEKNPNTGEDFPGTELRVAHNSIHLGKDHPSALLLPVRPVTGP